MKTRILFATAAVLAAALSLVSCSKNEPAPTSEGQPLTLTVTMPGNAGTRAVYEANILYGAFKGLKTKWELGDEIAVGDYFSEEIATFRAVSVSDDGKTATFAGNALAAWGTISDGHEFWSCYPAELVLDWRHQDGTLANLPNHDFLWMYSTYSAGGLILDDTYRDIYIFRFPKGFAFCDKEVNGDVLLEFSGENAFSTYNSGTDSFTPAIGKDIIHVGPVSVSAGALTEDVYVAVADGFKAYPLQELNIGVMPEDFSWALKYQLDYPDGMNSGNVYTITSVSKLQLLADVQFVDLGLSSGLKWAKWNLGATSPEEYGNYYAWGETAPKTDYSWATYFDNPSGDGATFTKYAKTLKTLLQPEDDAAQVTLGGKFRMPTPADWKELIENCSWTWKTTTDEYGTKGYEVTAANGKTIFLPAAGYQDGTIRIDVGSVGYYWCSPLYPDSSDLAYRLDFNYESIYRRSATRSSGFSVRAVCD